MSATRSAFELRLGMSCAGRHGGQLVELALRVHRDIVLPPGETGHDVADREAGIVRRYYPAGAD